MYKASDTGRTFTEIETPDFKNGYAIKTTPTHPLGRHRSSNSARESPRALLLDCKIFRMACCAEFPFEWTRVPPSLLLLEGVED